MVKVVELDEVSRRQQVQDGCFPSLDEVPRRAITMIMPAIFKVSHTFASFRQNLGQRREKKTAYDPISTSCPASIIRKHKSATLFLDIGEFTEVTPYGKLIADALFRKIFEWEALISLRLEDS